MKFALTMMFALSAMSASAATTFNCFSHEEMGPVYTLTVGAPKQTADAEGNTFTARRVEVKEYETKIMIADGVGSASSKKIDLTLLEGGDMAMGSLKAKEYMSGRLTGTLSIAGKVQTDISCVVNK